MLGRIVYVHPLGEEMNKSRRMAALQARAFALAGYDVLQMDLLGCGDSSGDFGDATWQQWVGDVVEGCHWLQRRGNATDAGTAVTPLWLWGLRAGCLLTVDAARELGSACNFLFWQPPSAGKPLLQQFLRLKVAGDMLSGQAKGATEDLRRQLAAGSPVEIAGYMLSPGLASGLEQSVLAPPAGEGLACCAEWFELSTRENANVSPASASAIARWRESGVSIRSHVVNGPAFWQTTEIEEAPGLISATVAAVAEFSRRAPGQVPA